MHCLLYFKLNTIDDLSFHKLKLKQTQRLYWNKKANYKSLKPSNSFYKTELSIQCKATVALL